MYITAYASGTQTATVTTEHFLSSPNVAGKFKLILDLVNMAAGDVLEVRMYQMVLTGGTQRVKEPLLMFAGAQPTDALIVETDFVINELTDTNAVRFSIKQTFGTGRNFPWKVMNEVTAPANISALSIDASGRLDIIKIAGTTQTARDIGASVLLSAGTGTGQLDFTSGVVKASLAQILGTAFTEGAAGRIAAAFKQFFNIAAPASTMDRVVLVDTATAVTNPVTTTYQVKKNTALSNFEFPMFDSTNHNPATGLTVSGTVSIDGAAFAALTNSITEVASGIYKVNLAAADLNGNVITLKFTASGADTQFISIVTQT